MANGSQNMVSDKARQAFYLQAPNEAGGHTDQYGNLLHNRGVDENNATATGDYWNIKSFNGTAVVRVYWETGEIDGIGAHSITLPNGSQGEFYAIRGNVGVWMGIGSGNTNHGLYSDVKGDWMIYANSSGSVQVNGNAATATTWQYARTFTIGATGKSVKGDADVSWSMNEIMGASDSTKFYRGDKTWASRLTGGLDAAYLGVTNTTSTNGYGISLYGGATAGAPTYGIMFAGTSTFGTHGAVTSDWATYFTMSDTTTRGWIFRRGSTNVASIDGTGKLYLGYAANANNPGIYWHPGVESASDTSDAGSIYQIKSGVAGGTELRINQQNDAADCINLCTNSYIYLNSKRAFTISDSWLRINEDKGFSSGIYTGSSLIRTDNQLQVGSSGGNFYANSSGNVYASNDITAGRYVYCSYINESCGAETPNDGAYWIYSNSDGWLRKSSRANAVAKLDLEHKWVRVAGDTMTGLLTVTSGSSLVGIKVGGNYINAINNHLIVQNCTEFRFGTSAWDYDQWAGMYYDNANKHLYIGVAHTPITRNSDQWGYITLAGIRELYFQNGGATNWNGIRGTIADNDYWRIGGAGTSSNAGYMEIATADDGSEPIHVRQYTGVFSTLKRTLTLLDSDGNTAIPGLLYKSYGRLELSGKIGTRPQGAAITQPGGANPVELISYAASGNDFGLVHISNDECYVCNSGDSGYVFAVFDTDKTLAFNDVANASFYIKQSQDGAVFKGTVSGTFSGNLTGNVTGNVTGSCSGSSGSCTGNAASATKLTTSAGDGTTPVYFLDGKPVAASKKLGAKKANGYWGMLGGDSENDWIRTTSSGIIPYQSGGAGSGHCGLGTSSWYFSYVYADNFYGKFNGNCTGNAATATRASTVGDGTTNAGISSIGLLSRVSWSSSATSARSAVHHIVMFNQSLASVWVCGTNDIYVTIREGTGWVQHSSGSGSVNVSTWGATFYRTNGSSSNYLSVKTNNGSNASITIISF